MLNDFRQFALRGNVVDLAIGVIIGAAFGKIVESLVGDILMPVIGSITGGIDFSNYFAPLSSNVSSTVLAQAREQGAVLAYGNFITVVVNFLIVAFVLFLVVKAISTARTAFGRIAHRNPRSACQEAPQGLTLRFTEQPKA